MSTTATQPQAGVPSLPVKRFSVAEYERLIELGVFVGNENVELLEGFIVPKMTRNPPHDHAMGTMQDLLTEALPDGWFLRVQSAIVTDDSVPEPDLAIVRGTRRDFADRHPGPADLAVVIEVSDSSLDIDQNEKARIYARANIAAYWIVNLVEHRIEAYSKPLPTAGVWQLLETVVPPAPLHLAEPPLTIATDEFAPATD